MSLYGHLFFIDFKQDMPHYKYNPEYTGVHDIYVQMVADEEVKDGEAVQAGDEAASIQNQGDYFNIGFLPDNVIEVNDDGAVGVVEDIGFEDVTTVVTDDYVGAETVAMAVVADKTDPMDGSTDNPLINGLDISDIIGDEVPAETGLVPEPPPEVRTMETHDFISRMGGKSVVGKLLSQGTGGEAADIDSIIKDLEEPGECLYCGGSGRTRESEDYCPHCNRKPLDGSLDRNVDILQLMGIYIPAFFRTEEGKFDVDKILAKYKDESVVALSRASLWLRNLGFILDKIRNKDFKGGQTILGVHASMDNVMYKWMYAGISAALEAGFSTSGILNPLMIDIYNFPDMFRDVLFFELVSLDYPESFRKLEYICKQRAHHDKPTFIVTNVHLKDLDSIYPVSSKAGVFQAITSYTYSQEYRLASSVGVRHR